MYGYIKTETQMLNWVRSTLRKAWLKHPSRLAVLSNNRKLFQSTKSGRMVYHNLCAHCAKWYRQDSVEVNHKQTVGTCSLENMGGHVINLLLVPVTELEILCKPCHAIVTYSERSGLSMEDAAVEKKVIEFTKHPANIQKEKLAKVGIVPGKTGLERRAQARVFLASRMKPQT